LRSQNEQFVPKLRVIPYHFTAAVDAISVEIISRLAWTARNVLACVHVRPSDGGEPADRPSVLGSHATVDGTLRFTPQLAFDPGQRYHVVLNRSSLGRRLFDPASRNTPALSSADNHSTIFFAPFGATTDAIMITKHCRDLDPRRAIRVIV